MTVLWELPQLDPPLKEWRTGKGTDGLEMLAACAPQGAIEFVRAEQNPQQVMSPKFELESFLPRIKKEEESSDEGFEAPQHDQPRNICRKQVNTGPMCWKVINHVLMQGRLMIKKPL